MIVGVLDEALADAVRPRGDLARAGGQFAEGDARGGQLFHQRVEILHGERHVRRDRAGGQRLAVAADEVEAHGRRQREPAEPPAAHRVGHLGKAEEAAVEADAGGEVAGVDRDVVETGHGGRRGVGCDRRTVLHRLAAHRKRRNARSRRSCLPNREIDASGITVVFYGCSCYVPAHPEWTMTDRDFFSAQSDASAIKTRIVTKYFRFWASVMLRFNEKIAYFDFYSGPGLYEDGTKSTPIIILELALADERLRSSLIAIFNDDQHSDTLIINIKAIPGVDKLSNPPQVYGLQVDTDFARIFSEIRSVPSFTFIDPFGYKGVTLDLLSGMLKGWGCDLILFFSYNRINAAITNPAFREHATKLFGATRLAQLRVAVANRKPQERESLILDAFSAALRDMGFQFVLPFTFQRPGMKRVSHHLIFISKNKFAYTVMKEIMAGESSEQNQGVPTFTYTTSLSRDETPLLFLLEQPIENLGETLLKEFAGRTMSVEEIYEAHQVGTKFILRNYKDALIRLEEEKQIVADPSKRRPYRGKPSMGNDVKISFPVRG